MTVTATLVDGVFTISGESIAEPGRFVSANAYGFASDDDRGFFDFSEEENRDYAFRVPVDSDRSDVTRIDASGVTGAGANIQVLRDNVEVLGSAQDDMFSGDGDGLNVDMGAGDDLFFCEFGLGGEETQQTLNGGEGDDTMLAGSGDDLLIGGAGADALNGGEGLDVAVYTGNRADYELTVIDGVYVLTDLREGAPDGADRIVGVERLQFADETIDLPPQPLGLAASIQNGVLTVSGAASQGAPGDFLLFEPGVSIVAQYGELSVRDLGALAAVVPASGDVPSMRVVDARGVQGAGVGISIDFDGVRGYRIFGSEQADTITTFNFDAPDGTRGIILGHGGDDVIRGFGSDVSLGGGAGNDSLVASSGDDTLSGDRGNDTIEGGFGFDVATYTGRASDYSLTFDDGYYVLTDLRTGARDGIDHLRDVEQLRFSDGVMDLPDRPTDLVATLSGEKLTIAGEAAWSDDQVTIYDYLDFGGLDVRDSSGDEVVVTTDGSTARTIDVSGLEGAGATIVTGVDASRVFGSAQDDRIITFGEGRHILRAGGGDDEIRVDDGRGDLAGGAGDDSLYGANGADTLTGNQGDDLIFGGDGVDVAVFSGRSSGYLIERVYDDYRVTDLRAGRNGVDILVDVEQLQFQDGVFDIATLVAPDDALIA